jgi:8-oxo-dGTP diphosphatase
MIDVAAAILMQAERVLIGRRRAGARQGGLWEFPGGKIRAGETPEHCLRREIKEELGIDIEVGKLFGESVYSYPDQTVRLLAYRCTMTGGRLVLNDHAQLIWAAADELDRYRFCPADLVLVDRLKAGGWHSETDSGGRWAPPTRKEGT